MVTPTVFRVALKNQLPAKQAGPSITAVARSSTDMVFVIPRVFEDDTPADTEAVQPLINRVVMYPLSQFDGKMKTVDYAKLPHFPAPAGSGGET